LLSVAKVSIFFKYRAFDKKIEILSSLIIYSKKKILFFDFQNSITIKTT